MPDPPAPAADSSAAAPSGEAEPSGSAGQLADRSADFAKMWSEAKTLGSDDDQQVGASDDQLAEKGLTRAADGKFKKGVKPPVKAKAAEPPQEGAPGVAKAKADKPAPEDAGTLAEARRMAREGDFEGALRIALGADITDIDEAQLRSPVFKELRRREKDARAKIAAAEQRAEERIGNARKAGEALLPVINAIRAYNAGDDAQFIQLATGGSLEAFLRRIAGNGGVTATRQQPPQSDRALAKVQELEARLAAREQEAEEHGRQGKIAAYKEGLAADIAELAAEDPVFERLATKRDFVEKVFAVQERFWNKGKTLPSQEAARVAFEELYGDVVQTSPRTARAQAAANQRRGPADPNRAAADNSANGRARTSTTIPHTQSAEAAPDIDLTRYDPDTFHQNQQKVWSEIERQVRNGAAG